MPIVNLELSGFKFTRDNILNVTKFKRRLRKYVKVATVANAQAAKRHMKSEIRSGGRFAPNKPSTVGIKGSATPLIDSKNFVRKISKRTMRWNMAVVGILRSEPVVGASGSSRDILTVAKVLHEGATVSVTQRMRNFFEEMSHIFPGVWRPLSPSTTKIRIPPRPFLETAIDKKLLAIYRRNWAIAVRKAIAGV